MKIQAVPEKLHMILSELDFTSTEIVLYLTLLQLGPTTVLNLANNSKIKRPTVHKYVEELIKKGLITQSSEGERRLLVAEKPEKLETLLDHKRWELSKIERNLPKAIDLMNTLIK